MRSPNHSREDTALHAVHRAWTRYGLALSPTEVRDHGEMIAAGEADYIGPVLHGREMYRLRWRGRTIWPVWCPTLRRVVTYAHGPQWARRAAEIAAREVA